jgi:4-amino-4-deoxy-L-arabinose transferase-like glycosyltransferase
VAAALLLLAQPLFLAQSTLLLPEIPMTLACLWSMRAFSRRRYALAGVFVALAIFIKETSVTLDFVLAALMALSWIRARAVTRKDARGMAALLTPAALYGLFLVIQKQQNGWYLYPFHSGQIDFHWSAMKGTLAKGLGFVFVEQGRIGLTVIVALWALLRIAGEHDDADRSRDDLVGVFVVFALAFLVFSAGNVFMKRYLLCLLPPFAILASRALFLLARRQSRVLLLAASALCLLCLAELRATSFNCAYDMSFRDAVRVQQEASRYLTQTVGSDRPILANFPTVFGLEDPRYGYVPRKFNRSSYRYSPDDEYIFASELNHRFEPPPGVHTELVRRFASAYMDIGLYRIVR